MTGHVSYAVKIKYYRQMNEFLSELTDIREQKSILETQRNLRFLFVVNQTILKVESTKGDFKNNESKGILQTDKRLLFYTKI